MMDYQPHPQDLRTLRAWRQARGLTQEQLARRVNVTLSTVASLEANKHEPTMTLALQIAGALGVHIGQIRWPLTAYIQPYSSRQTKAGQQRREVTLTEHAQRAFDAAQVPAIAQQELDALAYGLYGDSDAAEAECVQYLRGYGFSETYIHAAIAYVQAWQMQRAA